VAPVAPVAVAPAPAVAVVSAPAPAAAPAPAYRLATDELQSIAAAAGLEWVNSDASKISLVREMMANAPVPVRVPRSPKPALTLDDGPLVLVETRKDLSTLKLPFEIAAAQPPEAQPGA
jgi:ribonuclease E